MLPSGVGVPEPGVFSDLSKCAMSMSTGDLRMLGSKRWVVG